MAQYGEQLQRAVDVDIRALAERLGIELRRGGMTNCVAGTHQDKTPSMQIGSSQLNRFKCFSCGVSGSTVDLVKIINRYSPKEAIEFINGGATSSRPLPVTKIKEAPKEVRRPDPVILYQFWQLCDDGDWLNFKGLDARRFGIRKVSLSASELIPQFKPNGVIIPYFEKGTMTYARWRNLTDSGPRFLGLPDTDVILYGRDNLENLDGTKPLYLCEGESDTMSLSMLNEVAIGFPGATQYRLFQQLKRWLKPYVGFIPRIILAFDDDRAGEQLKQKVEELNLGIPIELFDHKGHKDVNDWYKSLTTTTADDL